MRAKGDFEKERESDFIYDGVVVACQSWATVPCTRDNDSRSSSNAFPSRPFWRAPRRQPLRLSNDDDEQGHCCLRVFMRERELENGVNI